MGCFYFLAIVFQVLLLTLLKTSSTVDFLKPKQVDQQLPTGNKYIKGQLALETPVTLALHHNILPALSGLSHIYWTTVFSAACAKGGHVLASKKPTEGGRYAHSSNTKAATPPSCLLDFHHFHSYPRTCSALSQHCGNTKE